MRDDFLEYAKVRHVPEGSRIPRFSSTLVEPLARTAPSTWMVCDVEPATGSPDGLPGPHGGHMAAGSSLVM